MGGLTPAAQASWRVAAAEAGSAGHPRIERGHLLVGLLSLDKLADSGGGAFRPAEELASLRAEHAVLLELWQRLGLDTRVLRRAVRERMGRGPGAPADGVLSRSESCKAAFRRAEELAGAAPASCLHLLAALAEQPCPHLRATLTLAQVEPRLVLQEALSAAHRHEPPEAGPPPATPGQGEGQTPATEETAQMTGAEGAVERLTAALAAELMEKHGTRLRLEPEARRFLAEQGQGPARDGAALPELFARLVTAQLSVLADSGKLSRYPAWRLVHDEGGVYALPDED